MNDVSRQIAKGLFYLMATALLVWTSTLTISFVRLALPDKFWLVPILALVIFDGGMVAWLFVFLKHAQGSGQRAVAVVSCLFDFIGVGLMVMAEVLLGGQQMTTPPALLGLYAIWGIVIWTIVNVAAVIVFHVLDPGARMEMALQTEKDAVLEEALKRLTEKRARHSGRLSEAIADNMMEQLTTSLASNVTENTKALPPATSLDDILITRHPGPGKTSVSSNEGKVSAPPPRPKW